MMLRLWIRYALVGLGLTAGAFDPAMAREGKSNAIEALVERADKLRVDGKPAHALRIAKQALDRAEKAKRTDKAVLAKALGLLAKLHVDANRVVDAEKAYVRLISLRKELRRGSIFSSYELVRAHADLGSLYFDEARYKEAAQVYRDGARVAEEDSGPESWQLGDMLSGLGNSLQLLGQNAEAEEILRRAIAINTASESLIPTSLVDALEGLGRLLAGQQKWSPAEQQFQQALTIREKSVWLGETLKPFDFVLTLDWLGRCFEQQSRHAAAADVYRRSLAIRERLLGPEHVDLAMSVENLADAYDAQDDVGRAEPLYVRLLAIREKTLPLDHDDLAETLRIVGVFYRAHGRYDEAEPMLTRSLALREKYKGPDSSEAGVSLYALGWLLRERGRYDEAERLINRSLTIKERTAQGDDTKVVSTLNELGHIYYKQRREEEAERVFKRALEIHEKASGPDHEDVTSALNNLGWMYYLQSRYADAEPLFARAIAIREKTWGPRDYAVTPPLNNMAALYDSMKRYAEAEALYARALQIREATRGPEYPGVAEILLNLARFYRQQNRYSEAEAQNKRALDIFRKSYGNDHPDVELVLDELGELHLAQSNWVDAAGYWEQASELIIRRDRRGERQDNPATSKKETDVEQRRDRFWSLVKVSYRIEAPEGVGFNSIAQRMFEKAQWALSSEAAASLAQMSARGARGDPKLAAVTRDRQDLVTEWQRRDRTRSSVVSLPADKRDQQAEAVNSARLSQIDEQLASIDARLKLEFPNYADLSRPDSLSVAQVQVGLGSDEALVLFLDTRAWGPTPEEAFIWVVTKTDARWVRSDLGTQTLTREVAALRCGLDAALWDEEATSASCHDLLKIAPQRDAYGTVRAETLPFDLARAQALYEALFGKVEDLIRNKNLLIVPSGPLTQLPFQVLVTAPSKSGDYKQVLWLARSHAITVLPAVSSLNALRRVAKASLAINPMIGFGNPLLDGNPRLRPWEARWAALARAKQTCAGLGPQQVADISHKPRGVLRVAKRGGHADLADLRSQMPLHDTADELCTVARDLKLAPDDIVLGAGATEEAIKAMSIEGKLASYRVLHFATHGTLAGEISGTSEPGLIFTPPKEPTDLDDGYLSASEVAALKLDADWVILSACNTAAGGAQGAEALSGLARAFIYAGARALLVSHWSVDSAATVKLITSAVGTITRDPTIGRAEALRRAMLTMIDNGEPYQAHPAYWAPFIVVGEGAAAG